MVQIAGKYQFSSRENFPPPRDDKPPPGDRPGPPTDLVVEVKVEGSKYTFITTSAKFNRTVVYEDGKETENPGFRDSTMKSKAKVSGDVIDVEEVGSDGKARKKSYKFTNDGYEETFTFGDAKSESKIIFKRL